MANETVREVCEEMYRGVEDSFGRRLPIYDHLADRIIASHQREMAAKDAEIARLNDELFAYAGGHVITGAERYLKEKNRQLEAEIARLKAALKPVMECDLNEDDRNLNCTLMRLHMAIREAQLVMKKGEMK